MYTLSESQGTMVHYKVQGLRQTFRKVDPFHSGAFSRVNIENNLWSGLKVENFSDLRCKFTVCLE